MSEQEAAAMMNGKSPFEAQGKLPAFYPTPTKHLSKEGAYPAEFTRNTPTLSAQVGGKLNPQFVEWLMGYPINHTDLEV